MSTSQQTKRGSERVVLVRSVHERRWRRITVTASDGYRCRSAPAVAAAEKLLAVGLPAPDRDHRNTALLNVAAPQLGEEK